MSNRNKPSKGAKITAAVPSSPRKSRVFTRGRPFQKGNPGKPKGARNKTTVMVEAMFSGEAAEIGRKAVELAKDGTLGAMKMVLDRAVPLRKGRTVAGLKLPAMTTAADAVAAMGAVARAVSEGALTIEEARDLSILIDVYRKTQELAEIERRVTALEKEKANAPALQQG